MPDLLKSPHNWSRAGIALCIGLALSVALPIPAQNAARSSSAQSLPKSFPSPRSRSGIETLQRGLQLAGALDRSPTGRWDNATREAIRSFQQKKGLKANGKIHQVTWDAIRKAAADNGRSATPVPVRVQSTPLPVQQQESQAIEPVLAPLPPQLQAESTTVLVDPNEPLAPADTAEDLVLPSRPQRTAIGNLPRLISPPEQSIRLTAPLSGLSTLVEPILMAQTQASSAPTSEPQVTEISPANLPAPVELPPLSPQVSTPSPVASEPAQPLPSPQPLSELALSLPAAVPSEEPVAALPDPKPESELELKVTTAPVRMLANASPLGVEQVMTSRAPGLAPVAVPAFRIPAPPPARDPKLEAARLKEIVQIRAEATKIVTGLETDPRYEATTLAPEQLQNSRNLANRIQAELENPSAAGLASARASMQLLQQEVAMAMEVAARQKAARSVQQITEIHQRLRTRWAQGVRRGTLANDMAAADKGFEALQSDFKAGRFGPIAEKSDGFKLVLERIEQAAASNWIELMLTDASVRRTLKDSDVKQVSILQAQGRHVEAADFMVKLAGDAVKKVQVSGPVVEKPAAVAKKPSRSGSSPRSSRRRSSSRNRRIVIEDAQPSRTTRSR